MNDSYSDILIYMSELMCKGYRVTITTESRLMDIQFEIGRKDSLGNEMSVLITFTAETIMSIDRSALLSSIQKYQYLLDEQVERLNADISKRRYRGE